MFSRSMEALTRLLRLPQQIDALRIEEILESQLHNEARTAREQHSNPLAHFGRKCFSQTDEDGITLEIIRRIGIRDQPVFGEFGVGDGTENNTLILAALGWRGFWIGGESIAPSIRPNNLRFQYLRAWITAENLVELTQKALTQLSAGRLDVVSIDLDGNDLHFARTLLKAGFRPELFIIEYNAKFFPPIRFEIPYDARHMWAGDDYFGASLSSICDVMTESGYMLVCCNAQTGANAFFVRTEHAAYFADVPREIRDIYSPPNYRLPRKHGHPLSVKTVEMILNK